MNRDHLSKLESLPMPITQESLQLARQFAAQQRHPQRQEQVYFNTLAVLAVRDYLEILTIQTDLIECDSWNPAMRLFADAADLYVKGLGKVECRPVRKLHQTTDLPVNCPVPVEARVDRIGYIAVAIDEDEKAAKLLGFSPTAETGELVLNKLHPLDDFLENLEHLFDAKVDLNQWLMNVFNPDWQPFEAIFDPQPPKTSHGGEIKNSIPSKLANLFKNVVETGWQKFEQGKKSLKKLISPEKNREFAFRSGGNLKGESALRGRESSINRLPEADVMRAKLIDLGMRLGRTTVALLVAIAKEDDRTFRVHVQLYPAIGERYLPMNIKLSLISESGKNLSESQSRIQERCILLNDIEVERDESFSIRVALDDFSVTENFVI